MKGNLNKVEIVHRNTFDVDIIVDGEKMNGISSLDIAMRPGKEPKVTIIPAVNELQFGGEAAVEVYVDMLESATCKWLLDALHKRLGIGLYEDETEGLNASEAVYGFASWLTTRAEPACFGAQYSSSAAAELVDRFCKTNCLPPIRDKWPDGLKHPEGTGDEASGD